LNIQIIKTAFDEIETFFEEGQKSFEEYIKDTKTKRAVERNLEIIGEAVNRILNKVPEFTLTNSRKIIDTRNRIIHGYDTVSDDVIWGIIIRHLPRLREEVEDLLRN
jgi:uncharacterized protein with HEPN domain